MEKAKVLVATYKNLSEAQQVVTMLEQNDCQRGDIGLAVRDITDKKSIRESEVLVTVSVKNEDLPRIQELMQRHKPLKMDVRNAQWRLQENPVLEPNADDFIAVDRAEK